MQCVKLDNRGLILVGGDDAVTFLQGIITNDVRLVTAERAVYSCFLTPQGKYLADFFMYAHDNGVLLDVDKAILQNLLKRMTMFKLRSKVTLEDVSDRYSIHAVWNTHIVPDIANVRIFADPRASCMGYRIIGTPETMLADAAGNYALWQMQNGIANHDDFERERTSMLEANMDFLNALSWTKGCYMGQELTARTYYRGLTKKRFFPIELGNDAKIAPDTNITMDDRNVGTVRGQQGRFVLAHMMVESVQKSRQCIIDGVDAIIHVPDWLDMAAATTARK